MHCIIFTPVRPGCAACQEPSRGEFLTHLGAQPVELMRWRALLCSSHASNHGTEETHTSSATQVGVASEKPSHHVRCWTNDGRARVCLPHRWPCIFTGGGGGEKKLSLALLPLPQSTLPAPYFSLPPSVFYSTSRFFFFFTPPPACLSSAGGLILATRLVPSTEITAEKMT